MAKKQKKPIAAAKPKEAEAALESAEAAEETAAPAEPAEAAPAEARAPTAPETSAGREALISAGWALAVIAAGLGILALLARLPAV